MHSFKFYSNFGKVQALNNATNILNSFVADAFSPSSPVCSQKRLFTKIRERNKIGLDGLEVIIVMDSANIFEKKILKILSDFKKGRLSKDEALGKLKIFSFKDLQEIKFDTHRVLRRGYPESILCIGKTIEQIRTLAKSLKGEHEPLLFLKADKKIYREIKKNVPYAKFYEKAKSVLIYKRFKPPKNKPRIGIITAGASDIAVAEEAKLTCSLMGENTFTLYDVGVAGIHRIFPYVEKIRKMQVLIVIAGMEGALPSLISGLIDIPLIAVPTSIGYGANFQGLSALLTMLNSCSPGIGVVNIDNGFGAGYLASLMVKSKK